jgi:hypothetical protein
MHCCRRCWIERSRGSYENPLSTLSGRYNILIRDINELKNNDIEEEFRNDFDDEVFTEISGNSRELEEIKFHIGSLEKFIKSQST